VLDGSGTKVIGFRLRAHEGLAFVGFAVQAVGALPHVCLGGTAAAVCAAVLGA